MLRIKKLDLFIVKSFLTLFVGTFFICLFIFMMQFLWRYVDDLVGKGLDMDVMAQFFFYSALTLVPISLPLAILLASLITFGNFGERYELLAMKAAGISLLKIMRPLIVIISFISLISFYFQDVISPKAFEKLGTLIISMKQKSPELDIPEGVFYSDIPDYNLKVGHKNRDTGMLYDVLIYNFKDGFENAHIIQADSGYMEMTADRQHLWLHLYNGNLFENLKQQTQHSKTVPYRRESFREKHTIIEFDSDFNLADANIMKSQSTAKNMIKLQSTIDSLTIEVDSVADRYYNQLHNGSYSLGSRLDQKDSLLLKKELTAYQRLDLDSMFNAETLSEKQKILSNAKSRSENLQSDLEFKSYTIGSLDRNIRRHKTEWHKKITISLSCLLFFFIGAPLGGIIRKGGLGMPVVISVLMFIIYYIIDNTGYKMARDGQWIVWVGMWTSTAILAPLGLFLTYKSNIDSVVLNVDAYVSFIKRCLGVRAKRHLVKKEVVIDDPNYGLIKERLNHLTDKYTLYIKNNPIFKAPNYIKLWVGSNANDEAVTLISELEGLIEEMSNTKSTELLKLLNQYSIIPKSAHLHPFNIQWLNIILGIFLPVGLFFYFRIWIFKVRLIRDFRQIIKLNQEVIKVIDNIKA